MKKSYEILPADMIASATRGGGDVTEPKPYEILPGAGVAAQGLVGWTKDATWIARGVATQGTFSSQAVGLPYDPVGTLPMQGDAAVHRSGKMFEILPVGLSGSVTGSAAKVSKPYEIVPASETAAQGLGGWTKGASSVATELPASRPSGNEGIGLPYDPAGAVPTRGAKPIPPAVKRSKEYEIRPGAETANLGLGGKSGGCGCGGGCGGSKGYEILPPGMKKSGGCGGKCGGASKAGGCGCGGKCGGHGDGIILPPTAGILLPPSWSSDVPSDVSRISEGYSPGWLADWSPWGAAGWRFEGDLGLSISPSGQTGCGDLQKRINDLYERFRRLEGTPPPPAPACDGPSDWFPCDRIPRESPAYVECHCFRYAQGLSGGTGSLTCPGVNPPATREEEAERRSAAHDVCNRTRVGPELLDELYRLLGEQLRRHCPLDPRLPWPRPDPQFCFHHPEICFRIDCLRSPDSPLCREWRLPRWVTQRPPSPVRDPEYCTRGLVEFNQRTAMFEQVMLYRTFLISLSENMNREAPYQSSGICDFSPSCAAMRGLGIALASRLANIPAADARATVIVRARAAVQGVVSYLHANTDCSRLESGDYNRCSPLNNGIVWNNGRYSVANAIWDIEAAACQAAQYANIELEFIRHSLMSYGCEIPPYLVAPAPCP